MNIISSEYINTKKTGCIVPLTKGTMKTTILLIMGYNMGKIEGKTISDLISSHCSVFDVSSYPSTMSIPGASVFQVDYLRFYVPEDKLTIYGTPWDGSQVRDNPNYEPTEFENVYKMTEYKTSLYSYNLPGVAPVSVLRWEKVKLKINGKVQELVQIVVYGKGLKLYYSGHISWLKDYIIKYGGQCSRVDLCWDFKQKIPGDKFQGDYWTDLKRSAEFLNKDSTDYGTIYYGKKNSPFLIRIYDKTADLRKDKNIHSFLYPSWYMKECRRYEIELKGVYAKSCSPIEWLEIQSRTLTMQKLKQTERNNYKTLLYSAINCVECINYDIGEKILILQNAKDLISNKLKILIKNS